MNISYEDMKQIFSLEYGVRKRFPYANQYSLLMEKYLTEKQLSSAQQVRYMLMSLYPLFRASADNNVSFTTNEDVWGPTMAQNELLAKRIRLINERLSGTIKSSEEYLKLLGGLSVGDLASCNSAGDLAQLLFTAVIKGKI